MWAVLFEDKKLAEVWRIFNSEAWPNLARVMTKPLGEKLRISARQIVFACYLVIHFLSRCKGFNLCKKYVGELV